MISYRSFVSSIGLLALLAVPAASQNYDSSPAQDIIIPECIWAPATGGGTWVSELQILDRTGGSVVTARFFYGTSYREISNLWTAPPSPFQTVKFSNILSTMQSLDPSFTYYGRVGTLWIYSQDASHLIQAQARTVNGNYGKTFPGLRWVDSNSINVNRQMLIMDATHSETYRTFVGFFNATVAGTTMTISVNITNQYGSLIGNPIIKTLAIGEFMSFNPFVEAGLGQGTYDNCFLYISALYSDSWGTNTRGTFCFASSANNYTNDTAAHIAIPAN